MQRPRNVIVIHSPHSGRSEYLAHAITNLEQLGINIAQQVSIAELDELPAQGNRWKESGIDIAIAAGGDGLVGGVITHIAESGLPLGILPLGTANDIARSLKIPLDLSQAAGVIAGGKAVEVDVGMAQPAQQAPHPAKPAHSGPILPQIDLQKHGFFAHALTVGLNVQFARLATNVATRRHYGRLTYPFAAIETLKKHEAIEVDLRFEGLALPQTNIFTHQRQDAGAAMEKEQMFLHCRALQVAVINAPIFGGQWQLAVPQATISDRLLDIVVVEDIDFGELSTTITQFLNSRKAPLTPPTNWREAHFGHLPAELTGIPGIHHLQASGIIITTNADPQDATLDGEVRGQTPLFVCLANERLRVMIPG